MLTIQDVKSFLATTKTGRTLLAEHEREAAAAVRDTRAPLAARLTDVERALSTAAPRHFTLVEAADANVDAARKALDDAMKEYTRACDARATELETLEAERESLRRSLIASAPPELAQARRQLQKLEQDLQNLGETAFVRRDPSGGKAQRFSTAPAVARRLAAVRAAGEEVDRLRLAVVDDLAAKLEALWESVGGPDAFTRPEVLD